MIVTQLDPNEWSPKPSKVKFLIVQNQNFQKSVRNQDDCNGIISQKIYIDKTRHYKICVQFLQQSE